MLQNTSQIEFPDTSALDNSALDQQPSQQPIGRVRSRFLYKSSVSRLKTMYLINILFTAVWTILSCVLIIYPNSVGLPTTPLPLYLPIIPIPYVTFLFVMFSLKFGRLNLIIFIRSFYRVVCAISITILVMTLHYWEIRRELPLIVVIFFYLYQVFLTRVRDGWPKMEEARWREYMDPVSKFQGR